MKRSIITMALAAGMLLSASAQEKSRVLSLAHDGDNLFIGTNGYGLVVKNTASGEERQFQTSDNYPTCMAVGSGTLYIGSKHGGLSRLSLDGGFSMTIDDASKLPTEDGIHAIDYDADGSSLNLTLCDTYNAYVMMEDGSWLTCKSVPMSFSSNFFINSIVTDRNGKKWIGSTENTRDVEEYGLMRVLPLDSTLSGTLGIGFALNGVSSLCAGTDKPLYVAAGSGLYSYDYRNMEQLYSGSACYDVQQSDDGTVWAVTKDALLKYDGESVTSYPTTSFESEGNVCLEVAGGAVYVGGMTSGVYKFENGEFTKLEYDVANGIDEVSSSSAIASPKVYSSDGKELDGLTKGLNIVKSADGKTVKVIR